MLDEPFVSLHIVTVEICQLPEAGVCDWTVVALK